MKYDIIQFQFNNDNSTNDSKATITGKKSSSIGSRNGIRSQCQQQHQQQTSIQQIPIHVQDVQKDPIKSFKRLNSFIYKLVDELWSDTNFVKNDCKASTLAVQLAIILPG
jgi:hypothetical protein